MSVKKIRRADGDGEKSCPGFDLSERGWVPVRVAGELLQVGLRELLIRAHEIEDVILQVPPAASGLWRVLYAITARITKLDTVGESGDDWTNLRYRIISKGQFDPDAVNGYFDRHEGRFDLFDAERPWMQDPRLARECEKAAGVNKLVFGRPAGNNPVWFAHFTDASPVPIPAGDAAWWLLTYLYYGPSGRCSARTVRGQTFANSTAGPLRSLASYHPKGRNVFETLMAGLLSLDLADDMSTARDLCPWEADELPDPLGVPPRPTWPGGMLTGQARHAVLLVPSQDGEQVEDAYLTWAWRKRGVESRDPYAIWRYSKHTKAWYNHTADSRKALWREFDLLLHHSADTTDRPQVISGCSDLPFADTLLVRAFGFDQDGQTRDAQWYTATTPPIVKWLEEIDPETAHGIAALRAAAEKAGARLQKALHTAWQETHYPPGTEQKKGVSTENPWTGQAMLQYWPAAEAVFWGRVNSNSRRFDAPLTQFLDIAHGIADDVTAQHPGPRVVKAVSIGHAIISQGRIRVHL